MATRNTRNSESPTKNDSAKVTRFLEEMSWLFQSHSDIDAKSISKALSDAAKHRTVRDGFSAFAAPNPNIHFLVGILPLVLRDESIFPTNGSIAEFSTSALGLQMIRWEKKSKFELIGEIVCNAIDLDDGELSKLVKALSVLASGDSSVKAIVLDAHRSKRSWNEIIQSLLIQQR
jgi:hypothetical protein